MISFVPATPADLDDIEDFLRLYGETSMFLRSNLRRHGIGMSDARTATRVWLDRGPMDTITGLVAITNGGIVLLQLPDAGPRAMARATAPLAGQMIAGVSGETGQVRSFIAAAGLRPADGFDSDEILHALALDNLELPPGIGEARPARTADLGLVTEWRRAYARETLGLTASEAAVAGDNDARDLCTSGHCRLLLVDGTPVAMTALNATMPDMVQVGGVYTPPPLRGRGFARRVVALHLAAVRWSPVRTAVLFAKDPAALRAYAALGFRPVGGYSVVLYRQPQRMESVA